MYNLYNVKENKHSSYDELYEFCQKHWLDICPLINSGKLNNNYDIKDIRKMFHEFANRDSIAFPWIRKEWIVVKVEDNPLLSFKVISNEYLTRKRK